MNQQLVHAGMVTTSSAGPASALVTILVWLLGLYHVDVPINVAMAFGVIFTAVIGLIIHRNMSAPDAPAADSSGAKPAPAAGVAEVVKAALIFLFVFVPLVLVACAAQPPAATLSEICDGIAGGYETAAGYRYQHKLSQSAIDTLTDLQPAAKRLCDPSTSPADQQAAISSASDILRQIGLINAGAH